MAEHPEIITQWREAGPLTWAESNWLLQDGQPVKLTQWQRAILAAWWEHRTEVTTLGISNVKKTGKTFLTAVLTAWRWLSMPGLHFCAANDLDQAQGRQFLEIRDMVLRHPQLSQLVTVSKSELIFTPTGSTLNALAMDAPGASGANFLTAAFTETWALIYESGRRMWEELTPVPGQFYGLPCLRIADSYAGFEGDSLTWHELVDRGQAGERLPGEWPIYQAGGLLLFHATGQEARDRCFRGTQEEAQSYYTEQRASLRPNAFTRMHDNRRTTGESAFLPPEAWEACYSPDCKPIALKDGRRMVLGADASTSRDLTALVGTINTGTTVDVVYCKTWQPKRGLFRQGKPTVDLEQSIGAEVLELARSGMVESVYCDPFQLHSLILTWERAGIRVIELAQNAGRVQADQALYDAVNSRSIRHYNDPTLNEHIKNAVAIETVRGYRLSKEHAARKIDAAVALSMSHFGALAMGRNTNSLEFVEVDLFDGGEHRLQTIGNKTYDTIDWNTAPHPAGVTWRTCRHRPDGCVACVQELEADGTSAALRQEEKLFQANAQFHPEHEYDPLFDSPAGQQKIARYHAAQEAEQAAQKIRDTFYKSIRR